MEDKAQEILGFRVEAPEPRETMGLKYDGIMETLSRRFKKGARGKEYNLITKYALSITNAIFDSAGKNYPIIIMFPYVRKEWIKASVHFQEKGVVENKDNSLVIKSPKSKKN